LANDPTLEFTCPHCQSELEARRSQVGARMVCANCKRSVLVPLTHVEESIENLMSDGAADNAARPMDFDFDFQAPTKDEIEQLLDQNAETATPAHPPLEDLEPLPAPAKPAAPSLTRPAFQVEDVGAELDNSLQLELGDSKRSDEPLPPIRLDDHDVGVDVDDTSAVTCRVCDTRIVFPNSKKGTMLKCPECFTEVLAVPRGASVDTAYDKLRNPNQALEVTVDETGELKLAEPEEVVKYKYGFEDFTGKASHREFSDPEGDLHGDVGEELAPLPPPASRIEVKRPEPKTSADNHDEGELQLQDVDLFSDETKLVEPELLDTPEEEPITVAPRGKSSEAARSVPSGAAPTANPSSSNPYQAPKSETIDPAELERERNPLGMTLDSLSGADTRTANWIAAMFLDLQLLVRLMFVALALTVAYWLFDIVARTSADASLTPATQSLWFVLAGLPGLIFFLAGWGSLFAIGGFLFEAGGNRRPSWSDWTPVTVGDYFTHFLQMLTAFWFASLPGLFLGTLVFFITEQVLGLGLTAMFFGMLFAPPFLLGSYLNGSPVKIFSGKLKSMVGGGRSKWLRYVPMSLLLWMLILIGSLIMLLDGFLFCLLGAICHVIAFVIYSSLAGLYAGLMADEISRIEELAALQERMKEKSPGGTKPRV
jgi:hypothetical protein